MNRAWVTYMDARQRVYRIVPTRWLLRRLRHTYDTEKRLLRYRVVVNPARYDRVADTVSCLLVELRRRGVVTPTH